MSREPGSLVRICFSSGDKKNEFVRQRRGREALILFLFLKAIDSSFLFIFFWGGFEDEKKKYDKKKP